MNILLHICCAPCEIYPAEALKEKGHVVAGFFYNPNIHPYSEYLKRKKEVERYSKEIGFNVTYSGYDIEDYFQHIVYNEALDASTPANPALSGQGKKRGSASTLSSSRRVDNRCPVCWWLRMKKTAQFAKESAFDAFTTTLLGSPYQDHEVLKSVCGDVAKQADIKFYYEDFTKGFKAAHNKAKSNGIYCQNYCGCLFSEKERIGKVQNVKRKT